jgi:hypothetical protein
VNGPFDENDPRLRAIEDMEIEAEEYEDFLEEIERAWAEEAERLGETAVTARLLGEAA